MRSGMDRLLAHVVQVFGEARPHHAQHSANRLGTRLKVLVREGQGDLACLPAAHPRALSLGCGERLADALPGPVRCPGSGAALATAAG